jgi:hypothetical protein
VPRALARGQKETPGQHPGSSDQEVDNLQVELTTSTNGRNGNKGNGHRLSAGEELDAAMRQTRAAWTSAQQRKLRRHVWHIATRVQTITATLDALYDGNLSQQVRDDLEMLDFALEQLQDSELYGG